MIPALFVLVPILFLDVVGSTQLSQHLDPEEGRERDPRGKHERDSDASHRAA